MREAWGRAIAHPSVRLARNAVVPGCRPEVVQEVADASGAAIGGRTSPNEIRRLRCAARLLFLTERVQSVPIADRAERGVPVGTKTITMYVSDLDQSEIPAGQAYQLSIRHPDGSTQ